MYIVQIGLTNVSEPLQRQQHYIPTRAGPGWNPSEQTLQTNSSNSHNRGLSPIQDSPVELPAQPSTVGMPRKDRTSEYYEDVDPRFAEPIAYNPQPGPMPSSLMPGGFSNPNLLNISNPSLNNSDPNLQRNSSYEDMQDGQRSPAVSEASHFTSVSQRGVNPAWRPPPPGSGPPMPGNFPPYGRRPMRQEDVILEANAANPDFAVPGTEFGRGRGRGRGGRGGGGGGRGGVAAPAMLGAPGMGNQGRYPTANGI